MANLSESSELKEGNKLTVPTSVVLILFCKFFERFCMSAISAILFIYLYSQLKFDSDSATAIYHTNEFLTVSFPIIGAILAEKYFGLFKTIVFVCLVAVVGGTMVSISAIGDLSLLKITFSLLGIVLVYTSLGSMRSNLLTFGADQYVLPEEGESQKLYFTLQMLFVNVGSLISRIVTPSLREDIKCFGSDSCYPLAFGVPSMMIFLAFLILICGKSTFIHIPPSGNMFMKMINSIAFAIQQKFSKNRSESKDHWLDYAVIKYGRDHVEATKRVLEILLVFIPTAIYWAVFMQQGSKWTYQAMQMDGDIGIYTIKPDQMIALNSIFSIILLPFCNFLIFPILKKIGLGGLLKRITMGGFLCCISFILAAVVEVYIKNQKISILWLIPQYAFMSLSEIFVYISIVDFAYTETPNGMKSVMTAIVFLLVALGNLLITTISSFKLFSDQVYEFLFYVVLLFISMIMFIVLSRRYMKRKNSRLIDVEIKD